MCVDLYVCVDMEVSWGPLIIYPEVHAQMYKLK